jgi:hypothetical protein
MKLTRIIAAAAAALLPLAASAGTLIIPAAGSGAGANGAQWRTELKLHAEGLVPINVKLRFHQGTNVFDRLGTITVRSSTTVTLPDVVATEFQASGTGAIEVIVENERYFRRLAVTSRTYNTLPNGDQLGQDVPALPLSAAAIENDFVIVPGPSDASRQRLNVGIYTLDATRVTWDLLQPNGSIVASRTVSYAAHQQVQYNTAATAIFGRDAANNDIVRASMETGKAYVYGSAIDLSGDPTYIPGVRTREEFELTFVGIDIDEDGTVDIADADGDGVLDRPLDVVTSLFPAIVRVIAKTEFGTPIIQGLEIVSSTTDAQFIENNGTLMIGAPGDFKGKTGEVRIRAKADAQTEVFVIPIRFL